MASRAKLLSNNTALTPKQFTFTLYNAVSGTLNLRFAPSGWDEDEYTLTRDLFYFGVFRKFSVGDLKFVKDSRDFLSEIYEREGVNGACTFIVTEYIPTGTTRNRFTGTIDFSTYKITELSVDVQIKDGSFTDLIMTRAKTDVNLKGLKSIDGTTLAAVPTTDVILEEITIVAQATWEVESTSAVYDENHSVQVTLINGEYTEAQSTDGLFDVFFTDALEEYLNTTIIYDIEAEANETETGSSFTWHLYLERWNGGILAEVLADEEFESTGHFPMTVHFHGTELLTVNAGDSFRIWAEYIPDVGGGDIQYSRSDITMKSVISDIPETTIGMYLYHEAFERLVALYTGIAGRFKSDLFGRVDIGYSTTGDKIGGITTGKYIRHTTGLNPTIPASLDKLFSAVKAMYCVGLGIETISGVEKIVIEEMEHFFDNTVILDISARIDSTTIEKHYAPDLSYNRIAAGYSSFDYESIGGVYEFNTTNKHTTPIKPVDKELDIVSPIRADVSGVVNLLKETDNSKDVNGEDDLFILDVNLIDSVYTVRPSTYGFDSCMDSSNLDVTFNIFITPARNLRRWGAFLRGFLEKYATKYLIWQTSDKNTKLKSKETGQDEIVENADILISTLADPLWHAETFTVEVPALVGDIEAIKENPYGLVKLTPTEYGWILNYKSKNEDKKSEFKLLRCNTTYVTPHLRVS